MKKRKLTDEEFDRLIEEARPDLKAMRQNSPPITPERIAELKNKLEQIHPFLRTLTKQQMRELMLELLKTRPLDASDLIDLIRKNNVGLKGATGEGELFGLLRELESAKMIEVKVKAGEEKYKLTELGRAEKVSVQEAELACLILTRCPA